MEIIQQKKTNHHEQQKVLTVSFERDEFEDYQSVEQSFEPKHD
jgi:hypothetical protein